MREIATDVRRWLERGERVVLATLVHVQRSAPRLAGAHWALSESGAMSGAISAGCVESDLIEWARSILADGGVRLVSYDVADADAMRIGLTCGGAIDVLIEVFADDRWAPLLGAIDAGRAVATAVAVAPEMLLGRRIFLDSETRGSIDAEIDGEIVDVLRAQLASGGSRNFELPWHGDRARVFAEAIVPAPRLVVVGATQTAIPLCRLAKDLDFHVTVVDPREVYASAERMKDADVVVREWPSAFFERTDLDENTYVVTLTHDEKFDLPTLEAALRSDARYVGALGSRRTHAGRVAKLRQRGVDDELLAKVHSPVGLDLGGRAPAEIALSIMAEIVAERYAAK